MWDDSKLTLEIMGVSNHYHIIQETPIANMTIKW